MLLLRPSGAVSGLTQVTKAHAASWDVQATAAPAPLTPPPPLTHAEAIAAGSRVPVASVFADWAGTGSTSQAFGYLDGDAVSVEVDRSYATALPDGVGILEGHASAELRVEVTGATADAVNRFNTASPLYALKRLKANITASLGMSGYAPVPQFTGQVRTISSYSRSGTARLEALDWAEKFRFAATVPGRWGVRASDGINENKHWLNCSWIIAEVLSQGGVHVSPPPLASCKLYASLHGSLRTRPGYGVNWYIPRVPFGGVPPFIAGRSALALYNTPYDGNVNSLNGIMSFVAATGLNYGTTGRVQFEFWALTPFTGGRGVFFVQVANDPGSSTAYVRSFMSTAGQLSVELKRSGQVLSSLALGPTPTGAAAWRYYAVHVAFSTTSATVTIRTEAAQTVTVLTVGSAANDPTTGTMALDFPRIGNEAVPAIQSLQVSDNSTADFSHSTFVPAATLDGSKLWLDEVPPVSALPDNAWELMTEIAAAEYATVELSETGVLLYRNADRWAAVTTPVATITATADLLDLAAVEDVDTVMNKITVPIFNVERERYGDRSAMDLRAPSTSTIVEAGWTRTIDININTGFVGAGAPISTRLAEGWIVSSAKWLNTSHPFFSATPTTGGTANAGEWDVGAIEWAGQVVSVTVTNTTAGNLYLGTFSALSLVLVPPDKYTATDAGSVTSFGARAYSPPVSKWRQQGDGAQAIANRLRDDLKNPVTLLDQVPVVGDPRRQLGDRIRVEDPTGLQVAQDYWIVGIRTSFKAGSLTQTLTLRPCTT